MVKIGVHLRKLSQNWNRGITLLDHSIYDTFRNLQPVSTLTQSWYIWSKYSDPMTHWPISWPDIHCVKGHHRAIIDIDFSYLLTYLLNNGAVKITQKSRVLTTKWNNLRVARLTSWLTVAGNRLFGLAWRHSLCTNYAALALWRWENMLV